MDLFLLLLAKDDNLKTKKHAGPKKAEGRVYKGGHYNYLVLCGMNSRVRKPLFSLSCFSSLLYSDKETVSSLSHSDKQEQAIHYLTVVTAPGHRISQAFQGKGQQPLRVAWCCV